MAAEQQLFLDPEAADSNAEHSEPRQRRGEHVGCKRAASIGLGLGALLALAVVASWGTSTKSSNNSALLELSGSRNGSGFGKASICGSGEEVEETTCAEEGSLVRSQGRAVAYMHNGCTGWLVKSETSSTGALMLTTGHCATSEEGSFVFDYVKPCAGGHAPQDKRCKGTRKIAKVDEDFEAVYELEKPCSVTHTRIPIKLDVGLPEVDEGIYIIGHPQHRPQVLSHEELNDDGHHCRLTHVGSTNVFYYCDTQGGNSGSPVFSAVTGHAIAIHKWGGCRAGQTDDGSNGGTLLNLGSLKATLQQLGIPFVDRSQTDLTYQGIFTEVHSTCERSSLTINGKDLEECKKLCLNSLSCTAIAHADRKCYIHAVRGTTSSHCPANTRYFTLQSRSLYRAPPDTTSPGGLCADTCSHPGDGECDDGGAHSHYDICALGTDCTDCGVRREGKQGKCENTCQYANDRECDDGGPNSHYSICELGTDCDDCGERAA